MSRWITSKELMEHWEIESFELFNCLKGGLQPYTQHGHKIVDSDTLEYGLKYSEAEYLRWFIEQPLFPLHIGGAEQLTDEELIKKIEKLEDAIPEQQPQPLNPPPHHMSFTLPDGNRAAKWAIEKVMPLIFRRDKTSEFAVEKGFRALAEPQCDPEMFIEKLTFSAVNDIEIVIKEPGKKPVSHGYGAMGFQNSTTNEWRELLQIVRAPLPFFELGKSTNRKNYDRRNSILKNLNAKLTKYLRDHFSVSLPPGFKLHELDKTMSPGTHRFVFKTSSVTGNDDESLTLDQLERFSEIYKTTNDQITEQTYFEKNTELGKKALEKQWITPEELGLLIREKDDLKYEELEKSDL